MIYKNLGMYRSHANVLRKEYGITPLDFDIVLYMAEHDAVSQYELLKHVSSSRASVRGSLQYLVKSNMIKVVRRHRPGVGGRSGLYTITGKARQMVTSFYMMMFPDAV